CPLPSTLSPSASLFRSRLLLLFFVGLALNLACAPLFFRFHEIQAALFLLAAMIVITIVLAHRLWPIRRLAAAFMLVYLPWLMLRSEEHTSELQSRENLV